MSELKKIKAPALSSTYGDDIDETFDNIQQNFDVLANQELYRGEAGTNLITVNLSWKTVFGTTEGNPIEVRVGSVEPKTYYILNFGPDIRSSLNTLSQGSEVDTDAAIDGLKNSGSITVCFADVETTSDAPTQVLSAIPFVFIDMRFRSTADYSGLDNRTDMSCVIMYAEGWECTQSFPTLYYNEGNLYWKINGQNTNILAQGPAGKDGSTGTVYVGLSDDLKINTVLGATGSTQVDITYLLQYQIISPSSEKYEDLSPESQSHLPFVTITDWINLNGEPINGAPIIVMGESSDPVDNLGVPYYISELIYNGSSISCNVSKYNICYAHMNDSTVKEALQKNVLFRAADPDDEGENELKGLFVKERGNGIGGYSIFVPIDTAITGLREFTFAYVDDIDDPKVDYTNQPTNTYKGRFRFVGGMTVGLAAPGSSDRNLVANGGSIAHGYINVSVDKIVAEGLGSHAGGFVAAKSEIKAPGNGAHAEGYAISSGKITSSGNGAHAEGFTKQGSEIKASETGAHAEGCVENTGVIIASGKGSHAEGCAENGGTITASGDGAHAEGYADSTGSILADGIGAHAEGYQTFTKQITDIRVTVQIKYIADAIAIFDGYMFFEDTSLDDSPNSTLFAYLNSILPTSSDGLYSIECAQLNNNNIIFPSKTIKFIKRLASESGTFEITTATHPTSGRQVVCLHAQRVPAASVNNLQFDSISPSPGYQYTNCIYNCVVTKLSDTKGKTVENITDIIEKLSSTEAKNSPVYLAYILSSLPIVGGHAEGHGTRACGSASHAEGYCTTASGSYSHAEGYRTTASGNDSHASHAEGGSTIASGNNSHAEGYGTVASGNNSHAEGWYTIADGVGAHACGKYNAPGWATSSPGSSPTTIYKTGGAGKDKIIFSIGIGKGISESDTNHRCNAFFVTESGKVWVLSSEGTRTYSESSGGTPDTYKCLNP